MSTSESKAVEAAENTTNAVSTVPAAAASGGPVGAPSSASSASSTKSFLASLFGDNPYFNAGFGLMATGVALTALRRGITLGTGILQRRMLVSVEISNRDRAYAWVLQWMSAQQEEQVRVYAAAAAGKTGSGGGSRLRRICSPSALLARLAPRSHQLSVETRFVQASAGNAGGGGGGGAPISFALVAGPGTHWLRYRGAFIQARRERELKSMHLTSGLPWETVTLTTLSRDVHLFQSLLREARDAALREQEGKLVLYTAAMTEWRAFGMPRRKRPLGSVVLADGVAERIESDVRAFLGRRRWYADRGIPYRRGYLLHGPPGSGKSSFIQALAGALNYDICLLNLSERGLGDDRLNYLMTNVPERSLVLVEDIDAAFNKRVQTSEDGYQSSVTFSGFLNALDGVASGEERIIFMTTNHLERLDPALIRPGRVDMLELIDDAQPSQAARLFKRFYSNSDTGDKTESEKEVDSLGDELAGIVQDEMEAGRRVSMAALQGLFIRSGPRETVARSKELFIARR